jgi:DNA-binding transcriptional LysR family regulator
VTDQRQSLTGLVETRMFVTVVEEGTFRAAAVRFGVSTPYVSKLVRGLEERLGARLMQRTTRKLALTDVGAAYYAECAEALRRVDEAAEAASAAQCALSGALRVTLPTGLGLDWLAGPIASFVAAHPKLRVDVHYLDRQVDLVAEGMDLAIRAGPLLDSTFIARRLAVAERTVCASASYLERRGLPAAPEALAEHSCLLYAHQPTPGAWTFERSGEQRTVLVSGPLVANQGAALVRAAVLGLGLVYVPEFHTGRDVAEGRLVRVVPEWGSTLPIWAIYPSARQLSAKVRKFTDHVGDALAVLPWRSSDSVPRSVQSDSST